LQLFGQLAWISAMEASSSPSVAEPSALVIDRASARVANRGRLGGTRELGRGEW